MPNAPRISGKRLARSCVNLTFRPSHWWVAGQELCPVALVGWLRWLGRTPCRSPGAKGRRSAGHQAVQVLK